MLQFDHFGPEPVPVRPGAALGPDVRLVFDAGAAMVLTVRRAERQMVGGRMVPTLVLRGDNRAADDWLGLEIDLPHQAHDVELTARNYPVHRLFPRLHYDHGGGTGHVDLPDVAASDAFATRLFPAVWWTGNAAVTAASAWRLTVLIPSTSWFAMEIQGIAVREVAHA